MGDAADILTECGLGIAVAPNDHEALWSAFQKMYEDREQFLNHKEHARNLILSKYSRQKAAVRLEQELMKIL